MVFKKVFKLFSILTAGCLATAGVCSMISSCSCSCSPWAPSDIQIKWSGDKTIDCYIKEQQTISSSWKVSGEKISDIVFKKVSDTQYIDVNEDGSLLVSSGVETPRQIELQVQAFLKSDETKVSNVTTLKFNFTYAPIKNIEINYEGGYTLDGLVGDIGEELSTNFSTTVQPFNACPDVEYSIISENPEIQNNNVTIDSGHICWSNKIPHGTYHFRVMATSTYDESISEEFDKDFTLNINWYPVSEVKISYSGSKNLECFMHENGNSDVVTTQVEPVGKTSQDVDVQIVCEPAAPNVQWNNEIKQITWTPFDTSTSTPIKITLTATSSIDNSKKDSIVFNLTVKEPNPERMELKFLTDSGADANTDLQPIINQDAQAEGTFSIITTPADACKDVTYEIEDDSGIGHNIRVEQNKLKWDPFTQPMTSPATIKIIATSTRVSGLQAFLTFTFKSIYAPVESVSITHPTDATFTTYPNTSGFITGSDGNPFTFESTVEPVNKTNQEVTWSLEGDTADGKISFDTKTHQISWQGISPDQQGSYEVTLKATSVQDPSKTKSFTFTLNVDVPTVQINWSGSTDLPTYYNISGSTTEALSASVGTDDADQTVKWEIINESTKGLVTLNTSTLKFSWSNLTAIGNYSFDVKATSTKYGSSATKHFTFTIDNALPTKLLNIDENGVVRGFVIGFNRDDWANKGYDRIKFPSTITGVSRCFDYGNIASVVEYPTYIKTLDFSGCNNLEYLSMACFRNFGSIENINFSGCTKLNKNNGGAGYDFELTAIKTLDLSQTSYTSFNNPDFSNFLYNMEKLESLTFPGKLQSITTGIFAGKSSLKEIIWNNLTSLPTISANVFAGLPETGTVKVTGSSTISKEQLLACLKAAGLPSNWNA